MKNVFFKNFFTKAKIMENRTKKTAKTLISMVLVLTMLFAASASAVALDFDCPVETKTDSILLVNLDTGIPVYEKNADQRRYPASTTKIMTYIVAYEHIENMETTRILIKQDILDILLGTGSSLSGLERHVGEKMTAKDLFYCLMVSSGNDAALVFADYIGGGNIQAFVDMMNAKAAELGCTDTHFANPHGLDDDTDQHYTTARDLYLITKYALTVPHFSEITNTVSYYCEGDEGMYPLITTNYMIDQVRGGEYYYTYARGIKTGTTDKAGRCLVSTAIADGYAYMCICLHAPYEEGGKYYTMLDSAALYRWALLNLRINPAVTKQQPVCEQKVNFAWGVESIQLYPEKEVSALVLKDIGGDESETDEEKIDNNFIRIEPQIQDVVDTPIKKGTVLGTAVIYYKDQKLETVNLVAGENVDKSPVLFALYIVNSLLGSLWFWLAVVLAAAIFVVYLILHNRFGRKKKKSVKVKRYRNF
jgi:D-alanyl-D-alanine carboxypeptidase (penicillin-binding protein 5/6)